MFSFLRDLSEVARALWRAPRFSLLCIGVLSAGIGLSSAMYSALNAVLLRSLPVRDQDRIVVSWGVNQERGFAHLPLYARQWQEFAARTRTLESVAAVDYNGSWPWVMRDGSNAYPVRRGLVSGGFFGVLGARPTTGRLLDPRDDRVGAEPVAVISTGLWRRQFGGDRRAVGRRLTMHATGVTYTIVGVAPEGLDFPRRTEIWVPIIPATTYPGVDTSAAIVDVVGRLRAGATADAMQNELTAYFREPGHSEILRQSRGTARSLPMLIVGDVSRQLTLLAGAVGLLLLVACLNVAGLLVMRGSQRARVVAVRCALGASPRRIVRWHLIEGLMLAILGGALGGALSVAALGILRRLAPTDLPRIDQVQPDAALLAGAMAIAAITAVLCATGPAFLAGRTDPATLLRSGSRSVTGSRRLRRVRGGLVVFQVAAAVVVLAGATLVARSLRALERANLGFRADHVMVLDLAWDFTRVTTADQSVAVYDRLLPRLRAIPGLVNATALPLTPFSGTGGWDVLFLAADRSADEQKTNAWFNTEVVSASYFDVFRVPLRSGRVFTDRDREGAAPVVVLSEGAARALWPNENALGKQLKLANSGVRSDSARWTVVGIVADTRYREYRRPRETVYFTSHQPPFPIAVTMLAVRVAGDPSALLPAIRAALHETTSAVVIGDASTMESLLDAPLAQPRFNAVLLAGFGAAAILIVAVGLYGVLAFAVRERSTEFAIRAAVGASPWSLRGLVWGWAGLLVGLGSALGMLIALGSTRVLRSMLYGVEPLDPVALSLSVVVVAVAGIVATVVPTRWVSVTSAARLLRTD